MSREQNETVIKRVFKPKKTKNYTETRWVTDVLIPENYRAFMIQAHCVLGTKLVSYSPGVSYSEERLLIEQRVVDNCP